jgi:hypothetical protein
MRPRFSIRWLLFLFASFALVLAVLFDSQTTTANRFVAAINNKDYGKLEQLPYRGMKLDDRIFELTGKIYSIDDAVVSATVEPRSWSDVFKFQRRIEVTIWFQKQETTPWQHYKIRGKLVASIGRLRLAEPLAIYPVSSDKE